MGTMKYIRARSQRKISTYSKRDSESRRAEQFKIPLVLRSSCSSKVRWNFHSDILA